MDVVRMERTGNIMTKQSQPLPPGRALLAMLAAKNISQSAVARKMSVTPTSMGRWMAQLDSGAIEDAAWGRIAATLKNEFNIDAEKVRPVRAATTLDTSLVPHLRAFKGKPELEALIEILRGANKQETRDLLIVLAQDRIDRR